MEIVEGFMILSSFALPGLVLVDIGGSSLSSKLFFLIMGGRSFILDPEAAGLGDRVAMVLFTGSELLPEGWFTSPELDSAYYNTVLKLLRPTFD